MQSGISSLAHDGQQEIVELVFAPVLVIDEMEGGVAGLVWYVELELYDQFPVTETF